MELNIYMQRTNEQLAFSVSLKISMNDIWKNTEIYTKDETNVKFLRVTLSVTEMRPSKLLNARCEEEKK